MYFASMEITRTFAPAFGKEAAILDRMLQRRLAQGAPDGLRLRSRLSQERPKRTALYLCTRFWEGHSGAPLRKKTSKKVPQKFGGYAKNSLPLQPLSLKRKASRKSDL